MVTMTLIALLVIFAGVIFGTWLNANSFKDTLKIIFLIPIIYYFFVKQEIDADQCGRQVQLIHFRSLILIHFTYVLLIKNEPPLVTPDM